MSLFIQHIMKSRRGQVRQRKGKQDWRFIFELTTALPMRLSALNKIVNFFPLCKPVLDGNRWSLHFVMLSGLCTAFQYKNAFSVNVPCTHPHTITFSSFTFTNKHIPMYNVMGSGLHNKMERAVYETLLTFTYVLAYYS